MQPDRRNLLAWGAGGALLIGRPREAGAEAWAGDAEPQRSLPLHSAPNTQLQAKDPMRPAFVDNVVMLAELKVKPERLDDFLTYTTANLPVSRAARGNLAFDILIDEARPDTVLFYEVWESPKAQQAYMTWRIEAGDLTRLLSFLAAEPKFTRLRSIAA